MNESSPLPSGTLPLEHLGVIRVEGEEAAKFIHGQLTHDFALLGLDQARLAAFCSPKGRMLASFIGFKRSDTGILLVCNKDLLPATLKRLSMFVMRAKAKLSDASDSFAVWGLNGSATLAGGTAPPWQLQHAEDACVVNLYPAGTIARQLWVAPSGSPTPAGPQIAPAQWALGEVMSGVAMISSPVVDAFVPQMLNYESVGGVNFKKGCYPGQEVVARSQFRGTLKRRAYIASCTAPMQPANEVFSADDDSQPVGLVVQSAPGTEGGHVAIVSLQISAASAGQLRLVSAAGPELNLLPLPYGLLEDI